MAKELPYFQFEPAEYLTKDVSFCTLSAQGLFINICSFYWQRKCDLTKDQFLRRFNYEIEFNELIKEGVIDLEEDKIIIKFLDNQFDNATKTSKKNSENGSKGGRPKKPIENPNESETEPKINPNESQSKGIKEDNIKENEIIKDKVKKEKKGIVIPSISEFMEYYKNDLSSKFPNLDFQVQTKYESWIENNWRDGNNKSIINWKTKLKATIIYFKPDNNGKQFTRLTANEQLEKRFAEIDQLHGINKEQDVSKTISERTIFDDYEEIP